MPRSKRRKLRELGPAGVTRFAALYRAACADLALADAYQLPPGTVHYLHDLVGRAHNQLYRSRQFNVSQWWQELFLRLPRRLCHDRCLWLAMALFWGVFLGTMMLASRSPEFARAVTGEEQLEKLQESFSQPIEGRSPDQASAMVGFYIMHNTGIGLQCFAGGLLWGVGGLFTTVFNAAALGAVFGYMVTLPERDNFLHFVTAHGPFELTAIVLSAAAGMRLGFAMIDTQGLTRMAALRAASEQAMPVMGVAGTLFVFAGLIEAFLLPRSAPYPIKAAVAVIPRRCSFFTSWVWGYRGGPPMQLDKTRISIRERSWLDILDLALARHSRVSCGAVGAGGGRGAAALINHWIVYQLRLDFDSTSDITMAALLEGLIALFEVPLATAFATQYLGQALFVEKPKPREILRQFFAGLPQLLFYQVVLRGLLFWPLVTAMIPYVFWPHLNEIILLEKTPWRSRQGGRISTYRRIPGAARLWQRRFLAGRDGFDVDRVAVDRGTVAVAVVSCAACWRETGNSTWPCSPWPCPQPSGWCWDILPSCADLSYLDLRIRREGWEVELQMRAERARWMPQIAGT